MLRLKHLLQRSLLQPVRFPDLPLDPVALNSPFKMTGSNGHTKLQARLFHAEVHSPERRQLQHFSRLKQLFNQLAAFDPFGFPQCVWMVFVQGCKNKKVPTETPGLINIANKNTYFLAPRSSLTVSL